MNDTVTFLPGSHLLTAVTRAQEEAVGLLDSPAPRAALVPDDFDGLPQNEGRASNWKGVPVAVDLGDATKLGQHRGLGPRRESTPVGCDDGRPADDAPTDDAGLGDLAAEPQLPSGHESLVPVRETSLIRLSDAKEHARRLRVVRQWLDLRGQGVAQHSAAKVLGVSGPTLCRWTQTYERDGADALAPGWARCGDRPDYTPTDYEIARVREVYVKLSESRVRGRGRGSSKVTAFRLVASGDDPCITAAFRQTVLRRTARTLPPSWERLLDTPSSVLAHVRDRSSTFSAYISTPRGLHYVDALGQEKPLRAGTILESDDGTVNFPVVVPWPYGGDACSDKFGVRVGRFQFLPVVDVRTRFCPLWHFVIRSKSSYRGEDIVALFGECFAGIGMPEALRLERGSWESNIVRDALGLAGVPSVPAWESKQKNAVENFFDRVWTPLSLAPGDVGRFRGDNAENTALLAQCEAGRRDPRQHFLSVEQATEAMGRAVAFVNGEPLETRAWGRWVPQALWEKQTAEKPLPRLPENLRIFFSRERREWTVRKGAVGGKVETPNLSFPVWFQHESLWEFEGCKVRCYFDPFTPQVRGMIVLVDAWRSYQPGHVIAEAVEALELPPQAILADGWKDDEAARSLAVRKAMAKAVRTESWNWKGGRRSEARDGFGQVATISRDGRDATAAKPVPGAPINARATSPGAKRSSRETTPVSLDDLRELDPAPAQGRSSSGYAVSMDELRELE